jgi:glycosyltransferase involved in cell wall biosynthesis
MTKKVLAVTLEPISDAMAGPAIRCLELSKQLSKHFNVTVACGASDATASAAASEISSLPLLSNPSHRNLYKHAREVDILLIQANVLKEYPGLAQLGRYVIVDLYDPYLLSLLPQYSSQPVSGDASFRLMHHVLEQHLKVSDFSVCASQRQRDYWLGRYCGLGRLSPKMYEIDPTARKLIDVVPFGVPSIEPIPGKAIKGKIAGINSSDQVLFWGGGIWEWFDPLTVIEAVHRLKDRFPRLRLLFAGWKSPNPSVPLMPMANQARGLADKLGVLNKHVFFHEQWIPYRERAAFLLDCDIAISAHFDSVESRFSYRTRILDYLWAGCPIVTTYGDELSQLIEKHNCGITVGYKDINGWVAAIEQLLNNPSALAQLSTNAKTLSKQFTWDKVAAPLVEFCSNPYHLPTFKKVTRPSLLTRASAVYERGGADLVIKRSKRLINDIIAR